MARRYTSRQRADKARDLIAQGCTDPGELMQALHSAGFPASRKYAQLMLYEGRTKRKAGKPKSRKPGAAKALAATSEAAPQAPRVRSRVVQGSAEDKTLKKLQMIRDVQQAVGGKRAFRKLLAFLDRLDTAKD